MHICGAARRLSITMMICNYIAYLPGSSVLLGCIPLRLGTRSGRLDTSDVAAIEIRLSKAVSKYNMPYSGQKIAESYDETPHSLLAQK